MTHTKSLHPRTTCPGGDECFLRVQLGERWRSQLQPCWLSSPLPTSTRKCATFTLVYPFRGSEGRPRLWNSGDQIPFLIAGFPSKNGDRATGKCWSFPIPIAPQRLGPDGRDRCQYLPPIRRAAVGGRAKGERWPFELGEVGSFSWESASRQPKMQTLRKSRRTTTQCVILMLTTTEPGQV